MFQTEKTLSESENKIPSDKKTEIDNTIKELRQHHLEKNIPMVEKLMGELNEQIQKVVNTLRIYSVFAFNVNEFFNYLRFKFKFVIFSFKF